MNNRTYMKTFGFLTLTAGFVAVATGCAERQAEYVPAYQAAPVYQTAPGYTYQPQTTYQYPPGQIPDANAVTVAPESAPPPTPPPTVVAQPPPPPQVEYVPVTPGP